MVEPQKRHKAFPVGWVTTDRKLLIAGGGADTASRIRHALLFDWLEIRIIIPAWIPEAEDAAAQDARVGVRIGLPEREDVQAVDLVIEDTQNPALAAQIAGWCREYKIPVNAVDKPWLCDVFYLSLVDKHPLLLAISSSGDAPALSSALRKWLENTLPEGWSTAAREMSALRKKLPDGPARKKLLKQLGSDPELLRRIVENDLNGIREYLNRAIDRM